MDATQKTIVRLLATGDDCDIVDPFCRTFCTTNEFIRAPLLDTGMDSEIQSDVSKSQGIIVIIFAGQIKGWMMKWLKTVCQNKPVLLFATFILNKGKIPIRQSSPRDVMIASLRSIGIVNVKIEFLNFDPESETFENPNEVAGLLQTFSCAASHFEAVPKAIFCSTPEEVEEYSGYFKRKKKEEEMFVFLRNMLEVKVDVHVRKNEKEWFLKVGELSMTRLDLPDNKLRLRLESAFKDVSVCNAMGHLMPLQIQKVVEKNVKDWLFSKKIGMACDIELTLKCPDEETRFSIQQSPITIEVER